jgi:hypothetical protein
MATPTTPISPTAAPTSLSAGRHRPRASLVHWNSSPGGLTMASASYDRKNNVPLQLGPELGLFPWHDSPCLQTMSASALCRITSRAHPRPVPVTLWYAQQSCRRGTSACIIRSQGAAARARTAGHDRRGQRFRRRRMQTAVGHRGRPELDFAAGRLGPAEGGGASHDSGAPALENHVIGRWCGAARGQWYSAASCSRASHSVADSRAGPGRLAPVGSPLPHLLRDWPGLWAHPFRISARTGLAPPTSAPGLA